MTRGTLFLSILLVAVFVSAPRPGYGEMFEAPDRSALAVEPAVSDEGPEANEDGEGAAPAEALSDPVGEVIYRTEPGAGAGAEVGPASGIGANRGVISISTATGPVAFFVTCPNGFSFPVDTVFPGQRIKYRCDSGGTNPLVMVNNGLVNYPAFFGEWVEFLSGGSAIRNPSGTFVPAHGDRFRLYLSWYLNDISWGTGLRVPFGTNVSGFFVYDDFDPNDFQLITKVVNGCGVNGFYWVFAGGATDLYVTVVAWDRLGSGVVRTYSSPLGSPFGAINDTVAIPGCP